MTFLLKLRGVRFMSEIVKIGSFREVTSDGAVSYMSYKEFLGLSADERSEYRTRLERGESKYYCACSKENDLPLIVSTNGVMRVASNKGQANHLDSCPKSVFYSRWLEDNEVRGVGGADNSMEVFKISLPSLTKSSSSSSSSAGTGTGKPREKRMSVGVLAVLLNLMTWEIQTFSKKKAISQAHASGITPDWEYKNLSDFNRLVFGVAKDIPVECQGATFPLIDICFKSDAFYDDENYRCQWFIYALVDSCNFKEGRVWQYVKVFLPSRNFSKTSIRVRTDHYETLFRKDGYKTGKTILAGFVRRSCFQGEDGTLYDYVQLTKGVTLQVNNYGLIVENERVCWATETLARHHVIFQRPYLPMENYNSTSPTIVLSRKNGKDVWVDFCSSDEDLEQKKSLSASMEDSVKLYLIEPLSFGEEIITKLCEVYGR